MKNSASAPGGGNDNIAKSKDEMSSSSSKSSKSQVQCKVVSPGQAPWNLALNLDSEPSFQKVTRKLEHKLLYAPIIMVAVPGKEPVIVEEQSEWAPLWQQCKQTKQGVEFQVQAKIYLLAPSYSFGEINFGFNLLF